MNLFNGSPETAMLLWSTVLGLVQLFIATSMATKDQGTPYNLSPRDLPPPPFVLAPGAGALLGQDATPSALAMAA